MAGSLIKINEAVADNSSNKLAVTGIDSTYDVYVVIQKNITIANASELVKLRVTKSGVEDTTSNYDSAFKQLSADRAFSNFSSTNSDSWGVDSLEDSDSYNGIYYLFNFANASEYSFITVELSHTESNLDLRAMQGGAVHTVASASDGLSWFPVSGNIVTGTMTLYGLKK
tara:strand:- start:462 stop:971 length:510 start_codon:yes stop_codon:yes gene_type:complete